MSAVFQTKTIFFPIGRLSGEFFDIYMSRYTVDVIDGVTLDGVAVSQTPTESDTELAAVFRDDDPLTRFRKASLPDGTLTPTPIYDPPLEPEDDPEEFTPIGHTLTFGCPVQFLADIANPPEGDEELFNGVEIVL